MGDPFLGVLQHTEAMKSPGQSQVPERSSALF